MQRRPWIWIFLVGLALLVLVVYLMRRFPGALDSDLGPPRLVYLLLWLSLLGASAILHFRARPGSALRYAGIWIALAAILAIGYSYRDLFSDARSRVMGELLPDQGVAQRADSISFRARGDGHFHVGAMVEGIRVRFLIDTGASDIVLSPEDARRLGFDLDRLKFSQLYATANGMGRGAAVTLRTLDVGPIHLTDVAASVNEAPMSSSLLGMSFLDRLSGYEVRGGTLTLWR